MAILCAAAMTAEAAPRKATCPQLRDASGDVDSNADPRKQPASDLLAVSLTTGNKATRVRVRLADLPEIPQATPMGHTYDVFVRGHDDVYKVSVTVANGAVRAALFQRESAQGRLPIARPR
jgi:hypothetical protein